MSENIKSFALFAFIVAIALISASTIVVSTPASNFTNSLTLDLNSPLLSKNKT